MDKSEQLEVSQADRDAAANIWRDYVARVGECIAEKAIREGASDCTMIVQAFARHRQATEARMSAAVEALEAVLPFTRAEELAEAAQVRLRKSDRNPVHKAVTKARQALAEIRSVTNG